jgi:hypothetical protein
VPDKPNDDSLIEVPEVAETIQTSDNIRASWNFSLDKIRQSTLHYSAEAQDAIVGLFRWCTDDRHPMWRTDAAASLKCSPNLLYQLLTGVYRNPDKSPRQPHPDFIRRVRLFLTDEMRKYESVESDFVETPTARKIFNACELARESKKPVILWGPSQIGKTFGLRRFQHKNNHGKTFMNEIEAACGLGGLVRGWAKSCAVSDNSCTTKLIERIKAAMTSDTLMIFDEVHLLKHTYRLNSFFACIEVIRRVWDFRKMGLLLSWTHLDNLRNASQGELVQVWRRGVHKIALPAMPTKGDVEAIANHLGLEFPSPDLKYDFPAKRGPGIVEHPREVLRMLAKRDGLTAITERFRYAQKLAAKDSGAKLNWYYFTDAHLRIEKQAIQDESGGWDK